VKILSDSGSGSWAHLLCGLEWLQEHAQEKNIKVSKP